MKKIYTAILLCIVFIYGHAQYIPMPLVPLIAGATFPEHGFLGGKKFTFYPTINKYDFKGLKTRVEVYDLRDSLHLTHAPCSSVELTNSSEFAGLAGAKKVVEYFDTLFKQSGFVPDSTSTDTLKVNLNALDNRLIGFGSITAHGIIVMRVTWGAFSKTYCVDITDKDPHSPIGRNAFVTRKTATRVIQSAAIREAIEQLLIDAKPFKQE
jgi:hypothetical protein